MFGVLGLPLLVELGLVFVASELARHYVFENDALHAVVSAKIQSSRDGKAQIVARLVEAIARARTPGFILALEGSLPRERVNAEPEMLLSTR